MGDAILMLIFSIEALAEQKLIDCCSFFILGAKTYGRLSAWTTR